MGIGIGFVSICLSEHECSPAGTVTVTRMAKLPSRQAQLHEVKRVAMRNLERTRRIMWFLEPHGFQLYRMSANLIPLATHELTADWAWWEDPDLKATGASIGQIAAAKGYRLSSHLPELCGLTAEPDKFCWTKPYLEYHERLFSMMQLPGDTKIVMHLGGGYGDKERALVRAGSFVGALGDWARRHLVLENDDRVYSAHETLRFCQEMELPMVFDFHHHWCNHEAELSPEFIGDVFATWTDRPPKVHLSSPRDAKRPRAHADYVDPRFVLGFVELASSLGPFDIMVEAKQKDLAALRLRAELDAIIQAP
jgi:UV DNA damage endonuclease